MELALCSGSQLLRQTGKRFVITKFSHPTEKRIEEKNTNFLYKDGLKNSPKYCYYTSQNISRNTMVLSVLYQNQYQTCSLASKVKQFSNLIFPTRQIHTIIKHDFVNESEIENTLQLSEKPYRKRHTGYMTNCHKCCSLQEIQNIQYSYNLFINMKTGDSVCRSCGHQQSWSELKEILIENNKPCRDFHQDENVYNIQESDTEIQDIWINSLKLTTDDLELITQIFPELAITNINTFLKFNIRRHNNSLVLPFYDITKKNMIALKIYSYSPYKITTIVNNGSKPTSLFGWTTISGTENVLILTSNEIDCLAISEATGMSTLALPLGATILPPECLPFLEQFDEILLWFREEYRAKQNLYTFAGKLGLQRCYSINSPESPSDLFAKKDGCILQTLQYKQRMCHDHIITFKDLCNDLFDDLIHAKRNAGVPFIRFPCLNEYLKGHRRGELTVFTGPTGSGKTTFLSELSIDLCTQGIRTLWGSFEIKNNRLINTMMHQFSGIKLENHLDKFMYWCEAFEDLPMYFMNYYGATDLKQVLQTIKYSVYTYDIEHVIIDNLQFMTTADRGEDKFQLMDRAISSFRKCASELNIHITVVVHPRKENDGVTLQTASIYGSAKASQEADNVLILQTSDKLSMQVSKNRYSGAVGTIPLSFHPESLCLSGFYRNVDTNEAVLPMLKIRRPIQSIQVSRKPKNLNQ